MMAGKARLATERPSELRPAATSFGRLRLAMACYRWMDMAAVLGRGAAAVSRVRDRFCSDAPLAIAASRASWLDGVHDKLQGSNSEHGLTMLEE